MHCFVARRAYPFAMHCVHRIQHYVIGLKAASHAMFWHVWQPYKLLYIAPHILVTKTPAQRQGKIILVLFCRAGSRWPCLVPCPLCEAIPFKHESLCSGLLTSS